jgi:hypothetical protein
LNELDSGVRRNDDAVIQFGVEENLTNAGLSSYRSACFFLAPEGVESP